MRKSILVDRRLSLERNNVNAIFAVDTLNRKIILVCSVYIGPQNQRELSIFCHLLHLQSLKCGGIAIFGDFNSHHTHWGDNICNALGKLLATYVTEKNLLVTNKFIGNTFTCEEGGSCIDIGLVSECIFNLVLEQYTNDAVELFTGAPQKGHIPVWTKIDIYKTKIVKQKAYSWNNTDWDKYADTVDKLTFQAFPAMVTYTDPNETW